MRTGPKSAAWAGGNEKGEHTHEAGEAQIARLERRYGMTSTEFLAHCHQGEPDDAPDHIERAGSGTRPPPPRQPRSRGRETVSRARRYP